MSRTGPLTRRLRHWGRLLTEAAYRRHVREERRLQCLPRRTPTEATLLGRRVRILDALSFICSREEIFTREVYRFPCDHGAPFILDGGSCQWFSDFWAQTAGIDVLASSFHYTVTPSGQVHVKSEYPAVPLECGS